MRAPCIGSAFDSLQSNWTIIRDECLRLDRTNVLDSNREGKSHEAVMLELLQSGPKWIPGWFDPGRWFNYGFCFRDQYLLGDAGCPRTVAFLKEIKGLKVAALSWFRPHLVLPVHNHPELAAEGLLTYHLGLDVPPNCFLGTENQLIQEADWKAFVFNG